MLEIDSQIKMIIANLNDKLASITQACQENQAYVGYIDEKLKSIEWDVKVLRNRINKVYTDKTKEFIEKEV